MDRQIVLEGCDNFRDLGGYPVEGGGQVRWRRLFRSDALTHLTRGDVDRLRDELGLGDVVDLRSPEELAHGGRGLLEGEAIRFHHVPLIDRSTPLNALPIPNAEFGLGDRYFFLMEAAGPALARVLRVFAESPDAAVFNCAAGKDRTGIVSAVVLGVLGVREEVIVADYAATRDNLDLIVDKLLANEGYQGIFEHLPPETLHAEPAAMTRLLERVALRHGSMAGYARSIGLSDAELSRLRENLVE